jgi:hypothetical protein
MKKLVLLTLVAAYLAGCTTIQTSQPSGHLKLDADAGLKADVVVGEKISGSSSITLLCLGFCFQLPGGPDKFAQGVDYQASSGMATPYGMFDPFAPVRAAAAYDAVKKSNADVIIAPRYTIEANDFLLFRTVNATVSGYKGTIRGFK